MKSKLLFGCMLFLIVVSYRSLFAQEKGINNKRYLSDIEYKKIDTQQIDFSQEFWSFLSNNPHSKNRLQQFLSYDCSSVWITPNLHLFEMPQQNGIIGTNYQRIQIHISQADKSKDNPAIYIISGKSKVNSTICDFSGEIELLALFSYKTPDSNYSHCASLVGQYILYEDSLQNHSGFFKGVMECSVYIDMISREIKLDDSSGAADYYNRTFVGTWTSYATKITKKCIWGDERLPYTFGFSSGEGQMIIRDKYVKNGWQSFNDGSEYVQRVDGKWELKDKWWLRN